jgi:hypothetical protein
MAVARLLPSGVVVASVCICHLAPVVLLCPYGFDLVGGSVMADGKVCTLMAIFPSSYYNTSLRPQIDGYKLCE